MKRKERSMNRGEFFEAAGQLADWVESLSYQTESSLMSLKDELCQKRSPVPGELPAHAIMAIELGAIRDRIGDVMRAFDNLCRASGFTQPYELAFRLLDASRPVQWKVKQVLDG